MVAKTKTPCNSANVLPKQTLGPALKAGYSAGEKTLPVSHPKDKNKCIQRQYHHNLHGDLTFRLEEKRIFPYPF